MLGCLASIAERDKTPGTLISNRQSLGPAALGVCLAPVFCQFLHCRCYVLAGRTVGQNIRARVRLVLWGKCLGATFFTISEVGEAQDASEIRGLQVNDPPGVNPGGKTFAEEGAEIALNQVEPRVCGFSEAAVGMKGWVLVPCKVAKQTGVELRLFRGVRYDSTEPAETLDTYEGRMR